MRSFHKIYPYIKEQWRLVLASLLLSIPMSAISSSPALLIKYLIDNVLTKKDIAEITLIGFSALIVGIYCVNMFVRFFFGYSARLANERIMRDVREKIFSHFVGLSASFFTESTTGSLMSRITNDVFYIGQYTINLAQFCKQILTFVGVFGYAWYLNPKLMIITLVVAPLLTFLSRRSSQLMKRYSSEMQTANGNVFSVLQETFTGFRVIKSFALEKFVFDRFKARNDVYVRYALKGARVEEVMAPTVELMGAMAIAIVVYVGGHDVIRGRLTPGELSAFFTCFALMIQPVRNLSDLNLKFSNAAASADRVHDALSIQSNIVEKPRGQLIEKNSLDTAVTFENVSFRYDNNHRIIFDGLKFNLKKGQTLALVGPSGQGKSTVVNLLMRFYDPTAGRILFDGTDARDLSLKSLRSLISVVSQDVFLFNDTVYNNIACGRAGATQAEVEAAARQAFAYDFIKALPEGFQTSVGERGGRLSGGERQRIAIARAILRNAPFLILDEATSSLDSHSEKIVQEALEALMKGRTTLLIAHRLHTVKRADEILVLADGDVVERGKHEELMGMGGQYAKAYQLSSM